ncbi:hypothetical protein EDD16DRAFT_1106750 [Pisolithus croceorrhizus]|nr:hypothetical protein EDD16DRAFT_1106750 [Pisolithus croceorrhizus]KAI6161043.1 hypothetical protein EDD17DRAFT_715038 [Pisolithus thermaeus]
MSAVALTQIHSRRRWLGWYNTPGSYVVGKRCRLLARSIIPGSHTNPGPGTAPETTHIDPALLYDGWSNGPVFKGIYSGTSMQETGPVASLLMKECIGMSGTRIDGRLTQTVNVTIAKLERNSYFQLQMKFRYIPLIGPLLPISVSLTTCALCGLYGEWYAFSMILLGILARGLTCVTIGSGGLLFVHPKSAEGSPRGDGILGCDRELLLLKGAENDVNAVTRGRFSLVFGSKHARCMIELCSFLLIVQAVAQLILVPQSNLFGQLMFVISIAISSVYNSCSPSSDEVEIREEIFRKVLGSHKLENFVFPNRCCAVVSLLLLSVNEKMSSSDPAKLKKIMDDFLPSGAAVWEKWKEIVIERLESGQPLHFDDSQWNHQDLLSEDDRSLLKTLLGDAEKAYATFGSKE